MRVYEQVIALPPAGFGKKSAGVAFGWSVAGSA
jgi:hypothetical protein